MRKNLDLVKRARQALGPDGEIMLDCWMAWTERYTIEMAQMMEPHRIYWMEEVLQPHDYAQYCSLKNISVVFCFRANASTRRLSHENHSRRVFHTRNGGL
jgi:L-alanine-DL-glutamate epimerase-like enolase superfamily enzyme